MNFSKIFGRCAAVVCCCALCGCASMSAGGKNPWAPPEKKKPLAERWEEAERRAAEKRAREAAAVPAAALPPPAPVVSVAVSREIAEVVFADAAQKIAVAYLVGGNAVPVKKGDVFAVRGKDMTLRGVARLDVADGDTLGFGLIGGNAEIGDFITIPGDKLRGEMEAAFPQAFAR